MHKLLFAFQICAKILLGAKKMNQAEHDFFLRGGQVFNKDEQPANPCADWISEAAWDNITELDKMPNFKNIISSFESSAREWREWCRHPYPYPHPHPYPYPYPCPCPCPYPYPYP